jgi:O-acetylserine/cysteine efflux transporter
VTQQIQVFFTVLLAAIFLGDVPSRRQILGMMVAFGGLAVVALTVGGDLSVAALALALGAAFSWSIGNTLVKRQHAAPIFALMAWCSLVPPLPSLAVSALLDRETLWTALGHAGWLSIAAAVYLGSVTTNIGFAAWGSLLQRYKAGAVAPFALLAPCTGIVSSALLFGEVFPPIRYVGMALILAGLAIILLPGGKPPPTVEPVA